ncbi:unnamed protein product [Cladocopium goreaui]|uniref:Uncharacterized protein n=1 Tax=Cladocopium goreaui TaxID=2562237 RepID=A0A9P1BQV1_9DINO|nr:unnamed protein product [Cladocopium goreaui]
MLSSVFGFSVPWLQQFHAGLVRQHASFTSEADVLTAQAARLRLLISQGWFTWRLLTRALGADLNLSEMDFLKPLEDMVALFLPQLQHTFGQNMLQAAKEAGMRCDVVVLDGNAKNRRAVCRAALAASSHSEHLPRRRPSAMLFAVGIAKDLWTEKITFRISRKALVKHLLHCHQLLGLRGQTVLQTCSSSQTPQISCRSPVLRTKKAQLPKSSLKSLPECCAHVCRTV